MFSCRLMRTPFGDPTCSNQQHWSLRNYPAGTIEDTLEQTARINPLSHGTNIFKCFVQDVAHRLSSTATVAVIVAFEFRGENQVKTVKQHDVPPTRTAEERQGSWMSIVAELQHMLQRAPNNCNKQLKKLFRKVTSTVLNVFCFLVFGLTCAHEQGFKVLACNSGQHLRVIMYNSLLYFLKRSGLEKAVVCAIDADALVTMHKEASVSFVLSRVSDFHR